MCIRDRVRDPADLLFLFVEITDTVRRIDADTAVFHRIITEVDDIIDLGRGDQPLGKMCIRDSVYIDLRSLMNDAMS